MHRNRGRWGRCPMLVIATGAAAIVAAGCQPTKPPPPPAELFSSATPGFHPGAAVVPAGICFVTIGAAGGEGGVAEEDGVPGAPSGPGGLLAARVPVTPGALLDVLVGGRGSDGSGTEGGDGGVGGGGGGGANTQSSLFSGGGGGGAAVTRKVVAAADRRS